MSNTDQQTEGINIDLITFEVEDHTGSPTLSAYSFEQTFLKFIPNANEKYRGNIEWIFGDGTTSNDFSPIKHYDRAGSYLVQLVVYGCGNKVIYSTYTQEVVILDFIPLNFTTGDTTSIETLSAAIISDALTITTTVPHYQTAINVNYHIDNSEDCKAWRDIKSTPYAHLDLFYTLHKKIYNNILATHQYDKVDYIEFVYEPVYVIMDDSGEVVQSSEFVDSSFYAGMTASQDVYLSHDTPQEDLTLSLYYDNDQYVFSESYGVESNVHNTTFLKIGINVYNSLAYESDGDVTIGISSNGMLGEGLGVDTFQVSDIKYINTPFQFMVTGRNPNFPYTIKYVDELYDVGGNPADIGAVSNPLEFTPEIVISYSAGGAVPVELYELTQVPLSGAIDTENVWAHRYTLKFNQLSGEYADITISGYNMSSASVSGEHVELRVYNENPYKLYKYGEEFSPIETIKSLTFQESMLNQPVLFDEFIGSIMGDAGGDVNNNFGVKTHEKITNFVDNNVNVDKCDIFALNSANNMVGKTINVFDSSIMNFPDTISRHVNMFSIDDGGLIGYKNKFQENFDSRGHTDRLTYGKNLGDEIDLYTYECSAGIDIVALEKFSGEYMRLNTYQPTESLSASQYPLSSYNEDFGWGLVLNDSNTLDDIPKFYRFFEFTPEYDDTILGGNINFEFEQTSVSHDEFKSKKEGQYNLFDVIMYDTLTDVLSTRVVE